MSLPFSSVDDIIFDGTPIVDFKKTFLLPFLEIMISNKFVSIIAMCGRHNASINNSIVDLKKMYLWL